MSLMYVAIIVWKGPMKMCSLSKTYGNVKLNPYRLAWDLCSLCCQVRGCVCDGEPSSSAAASVQIMVEVSKTWMQGIKPNWPESTLTSEIWKPYYASPEYQAFYCFQN